MRRGTPPKKRRLLDVTRKKRHLALGGKRHHKHPPTVGKPHAEELYGYDFAGQLHRTFAPVNLRIRPRVELQRNKHLRPPLLTPSLPDIGVYTRFCTRIPCRYQHFEDLVPCIALLAWHLFRSRQQLVDAHFVWSQHGRRAWRTQCVRCRLG